MRYLKNRNTRILGFLILIGFITAGVIGIYLFNMPHRNVQSAVTDYKTTASQITAEFLNNSVRANEKYLADDGESKILEVSGIVRKMSENFNGQKVVLLQANGDKAGVSCTFTPETSSNVAGIQHGQMLTVKGVIRAGASYDEDLEMYENVILEKSDIVN